MLNKVMLMGRLTRDPELTATQTGTTVTRFSIAVDRRFQKPGEERQADFFNIVCFNKTADFVKKWFVKGQLVCVAGSLQTSTWEKDGKKNYSTDVIADEVHFTGDKRENNSGSTGGGYNNSQQRPSNDEFVPDKPASDDGFMTVDDDQLPF